MIILERFIIEKLKEWKESRYRKPLFLSGARQVGKTYILKQFGEENYEGVAYFNFDHDEDLYNLFENTKDPKRILEQLAFIYGKAIMPEKTLIIFDEIQECPNALNSLKYFYEEANEYHIACAGSLLEIRLSHTSFPVGKVEFMNMHPMTFSEFLLADNAKNLVDYMQSLEKVEKKTRYIFQSIRRYCKCYFNNIFFQHIAQKTELYKQQSIFNYSSSWFCFPNDTTIILFIRKNFIKFVFIDCSTIFL